MSRLLYCLLAMRMAIIVLFSNCGRAIIRGQEVRIAGRVCMDWIMIDVTSVPDVAVGDSVTLLGEAEGLTISGRRMGGAIRDDFV